MQDKNEERPKTVEYYHNRYMFFQAAEGAQWEREEKEREAFLDEYHEFMDKLTKGVNPCE